MPAHFIQNYELNATAWVLLQRTYYAVRISLFNGRMTSEIAAVLHCAHNSQWTVCSELRMFSLGKRVVAAELLSVRMCVTWWS